MSSDESQASYSSEEVVWAKVHGYPWWPAFVDKVHWQEEEMEYTVQFFGDQTHSRLAASKLNKFQDHYAEHYTRARAHRRLMASIRAAEEKLSLNNQDVEVFKSIREKLKDSRRGGHLTSKKSRDDEESFHSEHTNPLTDLKKGEITKCKRTRSLATSTRLLNDEEESESDKASQRSQSLPGRRTRRIQGVLKKSLRFAEDEQEEQQNQNHYISAKQKPAIPQKSSMDVQHPLDACSNNPSLQKCSYNGFLLLKNTNNADQVNQRCQKVKRKRGRPRKYPLQTQQLVVKTSFQVGKHKPIHKDTSKKAAFAVPHVQLSVQDELLILEMRKHMANKKDMVSYLSTAPLSTNNVLHLLNLGVADVLQEGGYSKSAQEVCGRLKNLLFRKYFPNDFKPKPIPDRKVYKKKSLGRLVKEEEKSESQPLLNAEECRKKTIAKLHKFLLRQFSSQSTEAASSSIKDTSIQIEAAFFHFDSTMGDKYKSLALKVLSALKDCTEDGATVLQKLHRRQYSI